jgi:hypothetical protein
MMSALDIRELEPRCELSSDSEVQTLTEELEPLCNYYLKSPCHGRGAAFPRSESPVPIQCEQFGDLESDS